MLKSIPGRSTRWNRVLPHLILALVLSGLLAGCCTAPRSIAGRAPFDFQKDTFNYANELVWEYSFDDVTSERTTRRREPPATYSHHCFVVARAARQFFQHAHFDAAQPVADDATYRSLIEKVVARDPAKHSAPGERIVIPGYASLRQFSEAKAELLQAECGAAWQSYIQRGHWRMVFPFSRRHQEKMADQLLESLKANRPPVVHIVRFPQLSINHAILLMDAKESPTRIVFSVYDPNRPEKPTTLTYDRLERTFDFPRNDYFIGGRVDAYEVYRSCLY